MRIYKQRCGQIYFVLEIIITGVVVLTHSVQKHPRAVQY